MAGLCLFIRKSVVRQMRLSCQERLMVVLNNQPFAHFRCCRRMGQYERMAEVGIEGFCTIKTGYFLVVRVHNPPILSEKIVVEKRGLCLLETFFKNRRTGKSGYSATNCGQGKSEENRERFVEGKRRKHSRDWRSCSWRIIDNSE